MAQFYGFAFLLIDLVAMGALLWHREWSFVLAIAALAWLAQMVFRLTINPAAAMMGAALLRVCGRFFDRDDIKATIQSIPIILAVAAWVVAVCHFGQPYLTVPIWPKVLALAFVVAMPFYYDASIPTLIPHSGYWCCAFILATGMKQSSLLYQLKFATGVILLAEFLFIRHLSTLDTKNR